MKSSTGIWLSAIILILIGILIVAGYYMRTDKLQFTKKVTLRNNDQHPYGASLAYDWLKDIFPNSEVKVLGTSVINKQEMLGLTDGMFTHTDNSKKALIILTKSFYASDSESNILLRFVENGNDLFLSCAMGSSGFLSMTGTSIVDSTDTENYLADYPDKKFSFHLDSTTFKTRSYYGLNGRPFYGYLARYNAGYAKVLGTDSIRMRSYNLENGGVKYFEETGAPNFIQYNYGKGHLFIHTAPVAFTNYFLLEKNNREYYQKTLSVISPDAKTIIWDNYFVTGPHYDYAKEKSPFATLFSQPSFSWAIWLIIIMAIVFVLLELKRRQRVTPVLVPVKNEALDYVKTMGRLYFDKKDNYNLATKMSLYFMEYVRYNFKIDTSEINSTFVYQLAHKSGKTEELVNQILSEINSLKTYRTVGDDEIKNFYELLETFYNHN